MTAGLKPRCEGVNKRDQPCRNPALPGDRWCETPGHREYVLAQRGEGGGGGAAPASSTPAADPVPATDTPPDPAPIIRPVTAPAETRPLDLGSIFDGIARAPEPWAEVAAAQAAPAELPPPPEVGELGPPPSLPGLVDPATHFVWTAKQTRWLLAGPVNRLHARYGLDPLDANELDGGAEALAPVFTELFARIDPNSPYAALSLWVAAVYGPRLVPLVIDRARGRQAQITAPAAEAAPAAPESTARAGWIRDAMGGKG